MSKLYLAAIFLFMLAISPVFAVTTLNTSFPLQDTWNPNGGGLPTCNAVDTNASLAHGNETRVELNCNAGDLTKWRAMFQYDFNSVLTRIITQANWTVAKTIAQCASGSWNISQSYNNSWDETQVVQPLSVVGRIGTLSIGATTIQSYTMNLSTNDSLAMSSLYNNPSSLSSFQSIPLSLGCAGAGDSENIGSKEGTDTPAYWSFTLSDFDTAQILGTDVGTTYFDFESGTASSSSFAQADFSYNSGTNTLTPIVPAKFASQTSGNDPSNTLSTKNCAAFAPFSTSAISSLNPVPNFFDEICFNLSSQHGGRQFYGAIKILNNTNIRGGVSPEFDFFYAVYSSESTAFSNFTYSPDPPQASRNLTVSWTTSQATEGTLLFRFRTLPSGSYGSIITVTNSTIGTFHSVVIPDTFMVFPAEYLLFAQGTTSSNVTIIGQTQSFQTSAFQLNVQELTNGLHVITTDTVGNNIVAFVQLDSNPAVQTVTIQTNSSITGHVNVASFYGIPLGVHNITVSKDGYITKNQTINVNTDPFFVTVKLTKTQCFQVISTQTNTSCVAAFPAVIQSYLNQGANITSFYCAFNSNGCATFDSNGVCIQQHLGAWEGFACLDGFHPAGFPVNATVPVGQTPTDFTGTGVADIVGSAIGTSGGVVLGVAALIISMLFALFAGIKTHSDTMIGIAFAGSLIFFYIARWLDWWVAAGFVIITAALVSQFTKKTVTS